LWWPVAVRQKLQMILQVHTQVEVVVLCVAEGNEGADDVDERCISG
jgi:hypothetical protein